MTKPAAIKTTEIEYYTNLDLHQLETSIKELQQSPPPPKIKASLRAARQALRVRQRLIKSKAMEFERTNDHYLLIFDSTENFSKLAGHSVLFYTLTIADRIHRRYSVKNDTDDYFRSEDGIVSIRGLPQLESQLATLGIIPDSASSTSELHFYKLPRVYNDEQIAKLRDKSHQDVERITSIILPKSPHPILYNLILELNRLIYYNCKRVSDTLARETILSQTVLNAHEMLIGYLNFANAKPNSGIVRHRTQYSIHPVFDKNTPRPHSASAQNLFNILMSARDLRNCFANIENLHLIHHRELCEILEKLVEIERIVAHEYNKQLKLDHQDSQPKDAKHE